MLKRVIAHLNKKKIGSYQLILAAEGTGAQGLKVGTIYNEETYPIVGPKHLVFNKGGK